MSGKRKAEAPQIIELQRSPRPVANVEVSTSCASQASIRQSTQEILISGVIWLMTRGARGWSWT